MDGGGSLGTAQYRKGRGLGSFQVGQELSAGRSAAQMRRETSRHQVLLAWALG